MLRWLLVIFWIPLTLWIFSYGMYISFVYSVAILWALLPSAERKGWKAGLILGLAPLVIWNVGLVEYGIRTIDMHCRVMGYFSIDYKKKYKEPSFCSYSPDSFSKGASITEGPVLSTMEHIGVHGFNIMLATGGALVGLPEVAKETLSMSFADDPVDGGIVNQSRKIRQKQCLGGKKAKRTTTNRGNGDWMFRSSTIRKMVAKKIPKAKKVSAGKPKKFSKELVEFTVKGSHGANNNGYYGELLASDNLRVPLTLVVSDGYLHMEARESTETGAPEIDVLWTGTISYPPNAQFLFPIPTIYQLPFLQQITGQKEAFPLLLSEGIFCGMTLDGAMNVYTQEWHTVISIEDERLSKEGRLLSEQGWFEALVAGSIL